MIHLSDNLGCVVSFQYSVGLFLNFNETIQNEIMLKTEIPNVLFIYLFQNDFLFNIILSYTHR